MTDPLEDLIQRRDVTMTMANTEPVGLRGRLAYAAEMLANLRQPANGPAFVFRDRSGQVLARSLRGSTVFGRKEPADALMHSDKMSGRHFEVSCLADGVVTITDLQSKNGTFVNGTPLRAPHRLVAGDLVEAGDLILLYVSD